MKKLIAILMASMFAVGAAYASDAKKDDKKADAKKLPLKPARASVTYMWMRKRT